MCLILGLLIAMFLAPAHGQSGPRLAAASGLAVGAVASFEFAATPELAPSGEFVNVDGDTVRLADFHGKLVLLNFWATWCGPCVRELPDLDRLQAELGGPDFAVIALSSDRNGPAVVAPFLAKLDIQHLAPYNDKRATVQRAFKIFGLPTTVLLDPEGRELGRMVGPAKWDSEDAKRLIRHFMGIRS